ncbi:DUF3667 domain-containing protein [Microbulbifer echini]|uniref:DUF3667 domain-containing protein n=1 Tax=Microbulbifer echini TaxID=1529067 RepID=A0ABV4NNM9_9GAMM
MSVSETAGVNGAHEAHCANCKTTLLGPHCYVCGQPIKGMVRHFSNVIGDLFDTLLALDSRIWRTLPSLLLRPGFLTTEYFSGRRVRYVSPVRLFIFLCVTSFFVIRLSSDWNINFSSGTDSGSSNEDAISTAEQKMSEALVKVEKAKQGVTNPEVAAELGEVQALLANRVVELQKASGEASTGEDREDKQEQERKAKAHFSAGLEDAITEVDHEIVEIDIFPEQMNSWINSELARASKNIESVTENPNRFKKAFLSALPSTLLLMIPLFALMLWLISPFKRRLYMEHLIVALHSHAFICLVLLLITLVVNTQDWLKNYRWIETLCNWLLVLLSLWIPVYLLLMQKRIYQQGWGLTVLKYFILGNIYPLCLVVGASLTAVYTLAEL